MPEIHVPVRALAADVVGATTGAVLAVLASSAMGSPIGHPAVIAGLAAVAGVSVARLVLSRFRIPRPLAVLGTAVWASLVASAAVSTMAAVALSDFD